MLPNRCLLVLFFLCQLSTFLANANVNATFDDNGILWDMIKARLDNYLKQQQMKSGSNNLNSNVAPIWLNISEEFGQYGVQQVEVNRIEPISSIKEQVFNMTQIPIDQQVITFESKVLDNNHSLAFYTIGANAELDVHFLARLFVMTSNGSKLQVLADLDDTISDLKQQIKTALKMESDEQELYICINPLKNDSITLREAGLQNNSTILIKTMILGFQLAGHQDCELWLPHKNLAVKNVIARVEKECPFGKVECLIYNDRKLSSTTVIKDGSKIRIGNNRDCYSWNNEEWWHN
ncbi:Polyubiquitin-like protein [Aphelenchoides bicaudatus]|nr:Polyubiquitin-like protein [Aphelenchoides bicaudatus]